MAAAIRAHTNPFIQVRIQKRALRKEQARFSLVQNIISYNCAKRKWIQVWIGSSLCNLCVLCASVVNRSFTTTHHGATESTKVAQRGLRRNQMELNHYRV